MTPSATLFGRIAIAGATASNAAAAQAQTGTRGSASTRAAGGHVRTSAKRATSASSARPITLYCEKPVSQRIGSASALCTAQPTVGASGSASVEGSSRRVMALPRQVQKNKAPMATAATLNVETID